MTGRRKFLKLSVLGSGALLATGACAPLDEDENAEATADPQPAPTPEPQKPVVISTWIHGMEANAGAWEVLGNDGTALDAVEKGVMVTESDPENTSVGLGGAPDRDGIVTLDACIMNQDGDCGAVACITDIENPISVARKVMEETPHVMIVGDGAKQFALESGFQETNLLTPKSEAKWKEWLAESKYEKPAINVENHDTIGMLAIDNDGNLSGACTTSGWAYKMHGRVGDSPIIGSGLFVDNEIGAACATGLGEAVVRIVGSHLVVELMRQGHSPQKACEMAVERIIAKHKDIDGLQVGFIALNKNGEHGGYSVYAGFNYACQTSDQAEMVDTSYKFEWE